MTAQYTSSSVEKTLNTREPAVSTNRYSLCKFEKMLTYARPRSLRHYARNLIRLGEPVTSINSAAYDYFESHARTCQKRIHDISRAFAGEPFQWILWLDDKGRFEGQEQPKTEGIKVMQERII
ncbi:MAG TPA: hypothetical protein VJK03_02595 [Candidatus Nanoarchaeia archaeon]|nr:hypothetical protein [Candidatus Nanoarchaeia archaeon]